MNRSIRSNRCAYKTSEHIKCRRRLAPGQRMCWQHDPSYKVGDSYHKMTEEEPLKVSPLESFPQMDNNSSSVPSNEEPLYAPDDPSAVYTVSLADSVELRPNWQEIEDYYDEREKSYRCFSFWRIFKRFRK